MKKSVNGYFKFYNKEGISCRIKCNDEVDGAILIKFKQKEEANWMYHVPNRGFRNCLEVSNFILKNLENDNMVFKIVSMQKTIRS
jgi:hypothetical protein